MTQGLPKLALCLLIVLQTCDLVLCVPFDQITNIRGAALFPVSSVEWTQSWALMGALEPSVPGYCLCPHIHTPGLQTTCEPCPVPSLTCHLPVRSDWPCWSGIHHVATLMVLICVALAVDKHFHIFYLFTSQQPAKSCHPFSKISILRLRKVKCFVQKIKGKNKK